ncbi:Protein of unknown function [Pyronema omphalodes CBS 100304]|uniref:Uncharacterized protein n=1 Tax=Pyronema omphalodes (strain CBS 100304) TaxID=1076935 RepID=U4L8X9_PYROM|nr:Protein of unknown function [Pyronema omphalodes CBS 100304]
MSELVLLIQNYCGSYSFAGLKSSDYPRQSE